MSQESPVRTRVGSSGNPEERVASLFAQGRWCEAEEATEGEQDVQKAIAVYGRIGFKSGEMIGDLSQRGVVVRDKTGCQVRHGIWSVGEENGKDLLLLL